jgi:hypothetical protein
MKIRRVGAELFRAEGQTDRQTDRQTDMTKLILYYMYLAFCRKFKLNQLMDKNH